MYIIANDYYYICLDNYTAKFINLSNRKTYEKYIVDLLYIYILGLTFIYNIFILFIIVLILSF